MDNQNARTPEACKKLAEKIINRAQKESLPRAVFTKPGMIFADWSLDSDNCKKYQKMLHPEALVGVYDGKARVEDLASDLMSCGRV